MKVEAKITYTKIRELGDGKGMNSKVFLVNDPQLGAYVAAKEISKAKLHNTKYFEEAQAMYNVDHENVVPIHYACATDELVSIVMPYCDKGCLGDRIKT